MRLDRFVFGVAFLCLLAFAGAGSAQEQEEKKPAPENDGTETVRGEIKKSAEAVMKSAEMWEREGMTTVAHVFRHAAELMMRSQRLVEFEMQEELLEGKLKKTESDDEAHAIKEKMEAMRRTMKEGVARMIEGDKGRREAAPEPKREVVRDADAVRRDYLDRRQEMIDRYIKMMLDEAEDLRKNGRTGESETLRAKARIEVKNAADEMLQLAKEASAPSEANKEAAELREQVKRLHAELAEMRKKLQAEPK